MEVFDYSKIEKYYDKDYFDTPGKKSMYIRTSENLKSKWHKGACGWFNSVVPVKGKKLLDVGCGVGLFMDGFKDLGAEVYGSDVSDFCAEIVSKRYPGRFYQTRLENMEDVPEDFCDIVYCGDVMEHIPREKTEAAFLNLIRVTKPGGKLYIAIDTTSYTHVGMQDISHVNMRSWATWLLEMERPPYWWEHDFVLELKLREEKKFEGFPYDNWRFVVMTKLIRSMQQGG